MGVLPTRLIESARIQSRLYHFLPSKSTKYVRGSMAGCFRPGRDLLTFDVNSTSDWSRWPGGVSIKYHRNAHHCGAWSRLREFRRNRQGAAWRLGTTSFPSGNPGALRTQPPTAFHPGRQRPRSIKRSDSACNYRGLQAFSPSRRPRRRAIDPLRSPRTLEGSNRPILLSSLIFVPREPTRSLATARDLVLSTVPPSTAVGPRQPL